MAPPSGPSRPRRRLTPTLVFAALLLSTRFGLAAAAVDNSSIPIPVSSSTAASGSYTPAVNTTPIPHSSILSTGPLPTSAKPTSTLSDTNTSTTSAASTTVATSISVVTYNAPGASGTGPGGINVQPPGDDAVSHPFTPFPSPTQGPFGSVYPQMDPLWPPQVSTDPQVIPDFNPAWTTAWEKAKALIADFSIEEKVNLTTGVGWANGPCVGNTPPVPSDGSGIWKGLCLEDSPLGVRFADFATVFPAGINTAATWQRSLIRARGAAMGAEHKGKGVNIALGPMMNMGRVAQGGRNWEGFGADPYLAGEAAYETILGLQSSGVQACAKHYVNNEQETDRMTESSNVDDRTQHEIYAHPFLRGVMAGLASIMCSYNQINETYACENDRVLNEILKGEFGFRGFVMSDWGAQHSTLSAVYGLDMTMPGDITFGSGTSYFGGNLPAYVKNGSISEARLDDMTTRIAAAWYFLHQDEDYPETNFNAFHPQDAATNQHVDVQDDHYKIVREIGAASTVLLKNENNALPLKKPRSIALLGSDAGPSSGGPNEFPDGGGDAGILAMGWGSGTAYFTYLISPYEAIQARARRDRTTVNWNFNDYNLVAAGNIAQQAELAIVFINSDSGEQYITVDGNVGDRRNLTAWHNGDDLVAAVAALNRNTVVVVHSVGPLIVEPWIEHPNVTAVVWAGLEGTETGNALVDVLYGDVNPSGRLPYTIAKEASDYVQIVTNLGPNEIVQIPYTEKLLIDYRYFDANNIEPRFEFGFGLSYTTFNYFNLDFVEIPSTLPDSATLVPNWKNGMPSPNGEGSSAAPWLHEPAYQVILTIQNTGEVAGREIPQLYLHHPSSSGEPPSILRGFTDVFLQPGEAQQISITLSRYDLSVWDVVSQSWVRPQGTITFSVGASSRDFRIHGVVPN